MAKMWGGVKPLLYLFLLFALCSTAVSATTTVELIPDSTTVQQGNNVNVQIRITPDPSVIAAQVTLDYPSTLLSISSGPSDGGMFPNFATPSGGIVGYQNSGDTPIAIAGNLAVIQFTASNTNTGPAVLSLPVSKVAGADGNPLADVTVIGATITVEAVSVPNNADATVSIIPEKTSVCQGEIFNARIEVAPDSSVTAAQVTLDHPMALLSISSGPSDGGMFPNFATPSGGVVGYQNSGDTPITTTDNLAVLQFTANNTNTGPAVLSLPVAKVAGADGLPLANVDVNGASVTVTDCSGPPTPQPRITAPEDGDTINGSVEVTEVDDSGSDNITYNLFEYCADVGGSCEDTWTEIGNHTDDAPLNAIWNTKLVMNGDYLIRITMDDSTNGLEGTYTIGVTVENEIPDNSIPLYDKWNYISFPGTLDNATPAHVLENLSIDVVLHYNADSGIWENAATFGEFKPGTAYAIRVSVPQIIVNLDYKPGIPPTLQLYEGWNSVGLVGNAPGEHTNNAEAAFASIDDNYDRLVGPWVSKRGGYYSHNGFNENVYGPMPTGLIDKDSTAYMLDRYEGHWINMTSADLLD